MAASPQLGNFRAGAVAQASSTTISAASGGLAAIVGAVLVGLAFPALVRYRVRTEVSAAQPAHQ